MRHLPKVTVRFHGELDVEKLKAATVIFARKIIAKHGEEYWDELERETEERLKCETNSAAS